MQTKRYGNLIVFLLCGRALAQFPGPGAAPAGPPRELPPAVQNGGVRLGAGGSIPTGVASPNPIALSLADAIQRGLKYNLAVLTGEQNSLAVRAQRLRTLSSLLPTLNAAVTENVQQNDLAVFGIKIPNFPQVVGPFAYSDARAYLTQPVFDWSSIKNLRSADASIRAAQLSYRDSRDLVVQAVSNAYLLIISDAARLEATRARLATAQALYERAVDQKKAGVVAGIDELRANVERKTEQQRAVAQQNDVAKDKLNLARLIGLPLAQEFSLSDTLPFQPLDGLSVEEASKQAYANRPDYKSAEAQVRAAELAKQAATAERFPTLSVNANYGDIGPRFSNSHGTFGFTGALRIPIFDGGRIRADVDEADTALQLRRNQAADLRGRIDFEVRSALLDMQSAADQVAVAQENLWLAGQTLTQARDRFAAGVASNIEVVQAQESVAAANENYLASTYSHNLAKISLARAIGISEQGIGSFLKLLP